MNIKRSTGLYFILVAFASLLIKLTGPILLWEWVLLFGIINVGCKVLIKD